VNDEVEFLSTKTKLRTQFTHERNYYTTTMYPANGKPDRIQPTAGARACGLGNDGSSHDVEHRTTDIYQMPLWSKHFPDLLTVVIIVKTKLASQQRAHVVLFSSDLSLAHDKLILYYRLRFQIEFNFRDAKQFWGLEDFMNVQQRPVTVNHSPQRPQVA